MNNNTAKGTIDQHGNVTITFNSGALILEAPRDYVGRLKYLPCDNGCGRLLKVPLNVVGMLCRRCEPAAGRVEVDGPDFYECDGCLRVYRGTPGHEVPPGQGSKDGLSVLYCDGCASKKVQGWEAPRY